LADGINSGEIEPTEENLARFDQLNIMIRRAEDDLKSAEGIEKQKREEFAPISKGSPIASEVGRIAGQIVPTLAVPGAAAKSLLGKMGVGAASGAALGALQPTVGDESATEKGAIGAAVGAAVPAVLEKVAAPAVRGIINKFTDIKAKKLLGEAAPTIDTLKDSARALYTQIDDIGTEVSNRPLKVLFGDITGTLKKSGVDKDLHPKATALIRRLDEEKGKNLTVTQLDTLRKVAGDVAGNIDKAEARLGVIAVDKIDTFLDKLATKDLIGDKSVGGQLKEARKFWGRAKRSELVDEAVTLARDQASGFENGLRDQFRSLLRRIDKGRVKGFSPEEVDAMREIVQGTTAANVTKQLGKFGVSGDQATNSLMLTLGGGAGFALGGGAGAVAVPVIGTVSRALSEKLTKGGADFASAIVRAGPNAKDIVKAYLSNVPKKQRNTAELTELLMRPDVNLGTINETGNKLIDDAVFFASNLQKPATLEAVKEEQE
jgi:hypothetical protein